MKTLESVSLEEQSSMGNIRIDKINREVFKGEAKATTSQENEEIDYKVVASSRIPIREIHIQRLQGY